MTYLQLYMEALEERIAVGGKQADVNATFAEYNQFDENAFKRWRDAQEFQCAICADVFRNASAAPSQETVCSKCRGAEAYDGQP